MLQATFEQLAMKSINEVLSNQNQSTKMLFPAKSQLTRQNRQPLLSIDLIFYFKLCSVFCIVYCLQNQFADVATKRRKQKKLHGKKYPVWQLL